MIDTIFCYLADRLKDTGWYNPAFVYEYTELVKTTTDPKNNYYSVRPKYYKSKQDGYIDVYNWDVNGTCYLRKTGKTTIIRNRAKYRACSDGKLITMTFPIRLVSCIPKTKLTDSPFMDENHAQDLIGVMTGSYDSLSASIRAHSVNFDVKDYETESEKVWNSEITGVLFSETTVQKFSYISIDFTLTIKGDAECLQTCLTNGY